MLLFGLWNFFLNVAARYKEHPFNNINGFPLWILNLIWSVSTLVLALGMTGFMVWAGQDLFDWFVWGPLIIDLGIIVRAGIEAVADSPQSGLLRATWNGLWDIGPQPQPQTNPNGDGPGLNGGTELQTYGAGPRSGSNV
ncbi:hypothetical protein J4E91_008432 [Alternaria rosae]|nr:hypothetical protein J4E91_008432 [Alternaria rosae]